MSAAVTQLGYVGFTVTDVAAWRRLAAEIFAFEIVEGKPLRFRLDRRAHRIALYPGDADGLAYAGWEAADASDYAALVARVRQAGVALAEGSAEECAERQVAALAKFRDPNGFAVELYHGPRDADTPFVPSRPMSGFKTGPLGLGHIVLRCGDRDAGVTFYCDVLGLRVTDTCQLANSRMMATFLHCNARHHSLALTTATPDAAGKLSHLMVEANAMGDVGRAYDLCSANRVPLMMTLGQHTNDRMMSFYARSPSGFGMELGYGAIEVDDDTWEVKHWETGSHWGHKANAAP